jgi:hypothetical protein
MVPVITPNSWEMMHSASVPQWPSFWQAPPSGLRAAQERRSGHLVMEQLSELMSKYTDINMAAYTLGTLWVQLHGRAPQFHGNALRISSQPDRESGGVPVRRCGRIPIGCAAGKHTVQGPAVWGSPVQNLNHPGRGGPSRTPSYPCRAHSRAQYPVPGLRQSTKGQSAAAQSSAPSLHGITLQFTRMHAGLQPSCQGEQHTRRVRSWSGEGTLGR